MSKRVSAAVACAMFGLSAFAATAAERELFLAGGALRLCSSLSPGACRDAAAVQGAHARMPPRYALDAVGITEAHDPRLWPAREALRTGMHRVLQDAARALGAQAQTREALVAALETRCVGDDDTVVPCTQAMRAPWSRLDDDGQAMVLAALELPQHDGDARRRERAALAQSRSPHGAAILRAFVAAARERAHGATPRVAFVTASAFDPFDPVDFYASALREAGAEPVWWPVDAALAAAVFERRDCAALAALRRERLRLPGRERVYPDLVAQQRRSCEDAAALASLPSQVHGVFFAGGDQWKLRRAFFDSDDAANAWLRALREAAAAGTVVIGGTSAGSAVQSGAPMLSNGTSAAALARGAIASAPPTPGCARSGDCAEGLDEDAFTYWPAGGLGLAPGFLIDTHFSERAREPRLLRLLAQTGTRYGLGADETSALHLRWRGDGAGGADGASGADGTIELRALGAAGGWLFDAAPGCRDGSLQTQAYYLAPGAALRLGEDGAMLAIDATRAAAGIGPPPPLPAHALDAGALRAAAQGLAANARREIALPAGSDGVQATLRMETTTQRWRAAGAELAGIGPLRLSLAPVPGCAAAARR